MECKKCDKKFKKYEHTKLTVSEMGVRYLGSVFLDDCGNGLYEIPFSGVLCLSRAIIGSDCKLMRHLSSSKCEKSCDAWEFFWMHRDMWTVVTSYLHWRDRVRFWAARFPNSDFFLQMKRLKTEK